MARGCLYNQALAEVRWTGAGIKCLYCTQGVTNVIIYITKQYFEKYFSESCDICRAHKSLYKYFSNYTKISDFWKIMSDYVYALDELL